MMIMQMELVSMACPSVVQKKIMQMCMWMAEAIIAANLRKAYSLGRVFI
jgi:hypothetical protein